MITVKFFNNKYFYTTVTLFLILLIFEDTTLYRLYEMKKELNDEQMLRIGRQFFIHIQKPYKEIKQSHTSDSLKYVWKGNAYPIELDQYYTEYRKKHGL